MKYKKYYYNQFGFVFTDWNIDKWLRNKDRFLQFTSSAYDQAFFDIKLQPKHRHHRSVAIRNIRKIYGFTVEDLAWKVELCEHENQSHGVAVEQSRKRRLWVYYY